MPVDPWGGGYDTGLYDPSASFRPSYPYEDPWYVDIFSQGIDAARDVARGALSDYAYPDDPRYRPNVQATVYQYPEQTYQPAPQTTPDPGARKSQTSGFSISGNTGLWLIAGAALIVFANRRR